jgi:hypothetical protein
MIFKHNWSETADRYRAFWRGEKLDWPPVIFDTVGAWRHPMYNGVGYDYTKYGEDIAVAHWHTTGLHKIFSALPPASCMFCFAYAPDAREGEQILRAVDRTAKKGRIAA